MTAILRAGALLAWTSWAGALHGAEPAERALAEREVYDLCSYSDVLEHTWRDRVEKIGAFGEDARGALLRLAKKRGAAERTCAWRILGDEFRDERLAPILRTVVRDDKEDADTRGRAAMLLTQLVGVGALEDTLALLDDEATWVGGVQALGRQKHDRARDVIRRLMRESIEKGRDEKPFRRGALLVAIGRQRDEEMIPLVLADLDRGGRTDSNRTYACYALARIGTRRSLEAMIVLVREMEDRYSRRSFASSILPELRAMREGLKDAEEAMFLDEVIKELSGYRLWRAWDEVG